MKKASQPNTPAVKTERDFKEVLGALLTVPPVRNGDLTKSGAEKKRRRKPKTRPPKPTPQ